MPLGQNSQGRAPRPRSAANCSSSPISGASIRFALSSAKTEIERAAAEQRGAHYL
jgi:hypothetical protein